MDSVESATTRDQSTLSPEDRLQSGNWVIEWIKIDGNRLLITVSLAVVLFALLLVLNAIGVIAFTNENSLTRMASGMIAGTFSLVTLVVSVNQLILSQEFTPVGKFQDRFSGVMNFRRDIEQQTDVPRTPVEPTYILDLLADAIADQANVVADSVANHPDAEYRQQVRQYADGVETSTQRVSETLEESDIDAFDALSVAIEYDDGWQLSTARLLRNDAPDLSDETEAAFDELIELIRLFSSAQEHFKTVYLQRELTRFSQLTLYCGVPAVVSSVLIALLYGEIGGIAITASSLPYVISLLTTIVFLPLLLLAAFILRTATVTRRTATTGPMLLQQ